MKKQDWRNPDDYKYVPGFVTEKEFYAWQFLRRNPEYQADWNNEFATYQEKTVSDPDWPKENIFIIPDNKKVLKKWGIRALYDPDEINPESIFLKRYGRIICGKNVLRFMGYPKEAWSDKGCPEEAWADDESMVPDDDIAVVFDITLPINPQIKTARKLLDGLKKELKMRTLKSMKSHISNWKDYLRIYDAYCYGIKPKEIAVVVYPDDINEYPDYNASRKVLENNEKAKTLVNGGYKKDILIWE